MGIKRKLQEFNKRWSIIDDSSYEEEFEKFKTRVLNIFSDIDSCVGEEGITKFCQILGILKKWERNIINELVQEDDEKKFYRLLQIIFFSRYKRSLFIWVRLFTVAKNFFANLPKRLNYQM